MTGKSGPIRTSLCLLALLLSCFCTNNIPAAAEPEPFPPAMIYGDEFTDDAENLMLLSKLKQLAERKQDMIEQEREITEQQLAIQAILNAKAREERLRPPEYSMEEAEGLPVASAIVHHAQHSGKRTGLSYMSLCHFKICNMGRKRQS